MAGQVLRARGAVAQVARAPVLDAPRPGRRGLDRVREAHAQRGALGRLHAHGVEDAVARAAQG
ncbi:MAG: hypothetical protein ACKORL_07890, partial [Phycisphaerales bacterium]